MSNTSRFMIFQRKTSISSQLPPSHNILTLEARENSGFRCISYHTCVNYVKVNVLWFSQWKKQLEQSLASLQLGKKVFYQEQ